MEISIEVIVKTVINHLNVDELIELYSKSLLIPFILNKPEVLSLLTIKYGLYQIETFREFIDAYDEKYVTLRCLKKYSHEECLIRASGVGNLETITGLSKMFNVFSMSATYIAAETAAENGKLDAVQLLLDTFNISHYNRCTLANSAAKNGHINIAFLLVPNAPPRTLKNWASYLAIGGDTNKVLAYIKDDKELIESAAEGAAEGGHIELTQLLITKRADHKKLLEFAVRSGNDELVDYILSLGDCNYSSVLIAAIKSNNQKLIDRFMHLHEDPDDILSAAVQSGNIDIVTKYLQPVSEDQDYIHESIGMAAEKGHCNVVDILAPYVERGYETALHGAADAGLLEDVKYYVSRGAKELNEVLEAAKEHKDGLLFNHGNRIDKSKVIEYLTSLVNNSE